MNPPPRRHPGGGAHAYSVRVTPAPSRHRIALAAGVVAAVVGGATMALQSLLNGRLALTVDDAVGAALISFGSGAVLVSVVTAALPAHRAAWRRMGVALRERAVPRWYLVAGLMGTLVVFSQAATVAHVGVARFTVALVVGQVISGLVVDRVGFAGVAPRTLGRTRVAGAALMVVAAVVSVLSRNPDAGTGSLALLLLPLVAGSLISVQLACNGALARAAGVVWPATWANFVVGTTALALAYGATRIGSPRGWGLTLHGPWWLYLGGTLGVAFVALQARLVSLLGALLLGLAGISGQLLGGLVLAVVVPGAGHASAGTVIGTVVAVAAVALGAWRRGERVRPRPADAESAPHPQ